MEGRRQLDTRQQRAQNNGNGQRDGADDSPTPVDAPNTPDAPDALAGWRRGDEASVRVVFEAYYPRAVRLAVLSGLEPDAAHDCAQEAFTQAFERRAQLRDSQAFPLWFHRIVTRRILDALATRGRGREAPLDDATDLSEDWQRRRPPQPDELALAAEQRAQLWQRVQALPPNYRVPLVLRYYGDFTVREIAELMSVREGALRVTLSRALARLRTQVTTQAATPASGVKS